MSGRVGNYVNASSRLQTLIEHWDGTAWTQTLSANPGTVNNALTAVDALSSSDAWAVGYYSDSVNGPDKALALHWDGTQWSNVAAPSAGSRDNYLQSVTMIAANDVWAVGYFGSPFQTLIEHWNGSAWTMPNVPYLAATQCALRGQRRYG